IEAITDKKNTCKSQHLKQQADSLMKYYQHNRYRMKYHEYRAVLGVGLLNRPLAQWCSKGASS
ncbi:hypothetical protein, partial [Runella zeae]